MVVLSPECLHRITTLAGSPASPQPPLAPSSSDFDFDPSVESEEAALACRRFEDPAIRRACPTPQTMCVCIQNPDILTKTIRAVCAVLEPLLCRLQETDPTCLSRVLEELFDMLEWRQCGLLNP
jgi:hypothetical protein